MKKIIKNIAELIQVESNPRKWVAGSNMKEITTIKNAFVYLQLCK